MPQIKAPKYVDAKNLAQGMENGPDYQKNIQDAARQIRELISQKQAGAVPPNDFSDAMGSDARRQAPGTGQGLPGQTMGTNPDSDRGAAYAALDKLQRQRNMDDAFRQQQAQQLKAQQPPPPSDADFNASVQQFMNTRKAMGR